MGIELQDGHSYRAGLGDVVRVKSVAGYEPYVFHGDNHMFYMRNGAYSTTEALATMDLIEEV